MNEGRKEVSAKMIERAQQRMKEFVAAKERGSESIWALHVAIITGKFQELKTQRDELVGMQEMWLALTEEF